MRPNMIEQIENEVPGVYVWKESYKFINPVFLARFNFSLPEKLDSFLGEESSWFDASDYWRNWDK